MGRNDAPRRRRRAGGGRGAQEHQRHGGPDDATSDEHEQRPGTGRAQRAGARLPATTQAENVPWARLSIGRPLPASVRTPSALMATSTAPEVAPRTSRAAHRLAVEVASPGSTAAPRTPPARRQRRSAPAVDERPGRAHRGERARADAQQGHAELPVVDARVRLDRGQRRAPGAPEGAEGGKAAEHAYTPGHDRPPTPACPADACGAR